MVRVLHRALVGGGHVDAAAFWSLAPWQAWWLLHDKRPELFERSAKGEMASLYSFLKRKKKEAQAADAGKTG